MLSLAYYANNYASIIDSGLAPAFGRRAPGLKHPNKILIWDKIRLEPNMPA